jgi:hypothetical protein
METLKKLRVSRRFALQGAVGGIGVSLWLPVLDAMCNDHGTAFAQGDALPTTFGIFFWGNGYTPANWNATGSGASWGLPPTLQPFEALKTDMTFVTGLDMMDAVFKGHGWGVVYVLAGGDGNMCAVTSDIDKDRTKTFETATATQYQPTIDQIIGDAIHKNEPYRSIETGILPFKGIAMGTVSSNLAHRGPNNFLPPERDPTKLFNKLFKADGTGGTGGTGSMTGGTGGTGTMTGGTGGSGGTAMPSDISNKLRRSVLDAVLEDANRLKGIVGANDAQRIENHMDSIRTIELRIPNSNTAGTSTGGTGSGGTSSGGSTSTGGTGSPPVNTCMTPAAPAATLADMTAKSKAMNRLIAAAVGCNLTRVYTHLWSGARDDNTYPTIPINTAHHDLTHATGTESQYSQIEKYIMTQYADLAQVLKDTTIGATNALNQTLLYGISDVAEPHNHVMKDYRIILMGHAGGKMPGNRHVRLVGRKVTELMLTMQQMMGLQVTTFGTWDRTTKTISEIL